MKVVFEHYLSGQAKTDLSVEQFSKEEVTMSMDSIDVLKPNQENHLEVVLSKKQLHDFIGALLHIQAKMKR